MGCTIVDLVGIAEMSYILLKLRMLLIRYTCWNSLIRKTFNPLKVQQKLLLNILATNKNIFFAQEHNFTNIKTYADYKKAVSVKTYEELRPYIKKQELEKKPYPNCKQPHFYAQTSGTTGKNKLIPILPETILQYKHSQHIFAYALYKNIPNIYQGKVLAIVSPAVESHLASGAQLGSISGLVYQSMPKLLRARYVVPPEIYKIKEYEYKYYLIAAFALAEQNITLIATANPSTILKIAEIIQLHYTKLVDEIRNGNNHGLIPNSDRAQFLATLKQKAGKLNFADFWPNLKSVTTWVGGNCAVLIPSVRKLLSQSMRIVEMGYLASEFRGSITVDIINNKCIPTIHENFFEFVECGNEEYKTQASNYLTIDLLEKGKLYYIFVTTHYGLYRYFINDIVEVDGKFNETPTIRFVQKGKGVTNLTGEKLYENHLISAVEKLKEQLSYEFNFFIMLANVKTLKYTLYIESQPFEKHAIEVLESYLCKLNVEFKQKRQSGRLHRISLVFIKDGTANLYKNHCIRKGQIEGQFKLLRLQYNKDCSFDFTLHKCKEIENN